MGVIAFSCAIFALALLMVVFHKSLSQPILKSYAEIELENKGMVAIGTIILLTCTVLMAVSNYLKLPMWLIAFASAIILLIIDTVYKLMNEININIILFSILFSYIKGFF